MKFTGTVIHGEKVGSPFGISTANISLSEKPDLKEGVYAVEIEINGLIEHGVMHFGERKTFGSSFAIEVHILDFSGNIYEQSVSVSPQKFLRPTQKFQNADLLFTQIEKDIVLTQKYFLRKKVQKLWKTFPPQKLRDGTSELIKKIEQKKEFQSVKNILVYAPFSEEIPFVEPLTRYIPEKKYFFPRIEGTEMTFHESRFKELQYGKFGLLEPNKKFLRFDFNEPFLVFVPAQAVDKDHFRLGRGGGFYDRFLKKIHGKAHTICVVPEFAFVDKVPQEPHDQPVDEVIIL